ncbi:MAG TPA: hypothetical protein VLK84_02915 [Longimicrobium sp.]|nr:hypothetical protein [Longimicrobium sp.]
MNKLIPLLLLACALGACERARAEAAGGADSVSAPAAAAPATVVDSARTVEEDLRAFRAGLAPVAALEGGADSRDALVRGWVRAVEENDTATIRRLVLSRAEFAYLYYPTSRFTGPPTQLEPSLLWFMMQQNSEKGIVRVLRRLGGKTLGYTGHECTPPATEGSNQLWERCSVELGSPPADFQAKQLFGSVMEHGGRFKFVSYANEL